MKKSHERRVIMRSMWAHVRAPRSRSNSSLVAMMELAWSNTRCECFRRTLAYRLDIRIASGCVFKGGWFPGKAWLGRVVARHASRRQCVRASVRLSLRSSSLLRVANCSFFASRKLLTGAPDGPYYPRSRRVTRELGPPLSTVVRPVSLTGALRQPHQNVVQLDRLRGSSG